MRINYLLKCILLTAKSLLRNRIILLLLLIIPAIFFIVTRYTTSNMPVWCKLATVSEETVVTVSQRELAFIFIALAVAGLLSSFLSLTLIHSQINEHRRLIICGYRSGEIIMAKFILLMIIILFISVYIAFEINFFFKPGNMFGVTLGFLLVGFVYGSYGMMIGTIFRGELEGILFIVLLANLDIGWLQNPIFYIAAQNKAFIRSLPSFFPSQVGIVSAFSEHSITRAVYGSIVYGLIFLILALLIYSLRMRVRKRMNTD
jgi:hypothetical protein